MSSVAYEELIVVQLIKKLSVFYETLRFITVFTTCQNVATGSYSKVSKFHLHVFLISFYVSYPYVPPSFINLKYKGCCKSRYPP
jgi:hypothetical protein